jgi:uncharacterized protein YeaO (DUF488 family)
MSTGLHDEYYPFRKKSMASIKTKRVYEPPTPSDGLRILVDRLWPRGLRKEAAALDDWCKEIAPTPALRTWFGHRDDRFAEFKQRYLRELRGNPAVADILKTIGRRKTTLLYGARDLEINHAVVLVDFLERRRKKA